MNLTPTSRSVPERPKQDPSFLWNNLQQCRHDSIANNPRLVEQTPGCPQSSREQGKAEEALCVQNRASSPSNGESPGKAADRAGNIQCFSACSCVCVCICVCAATRTHTCTQPIVHMHYIHTHMHTFILHTYTHTRRHVYTHTHLYIRISTCTCICTHYT